MGNGFQERYGVVRWRKRVPPIRVILYSNESPLSYAQVQLVLDALVRRGYRAKVSKVELTFDVSGSTVLFFQRHFLTTARKIQLRRNERGETLYVGGPRSPWQLRVYDKAEGLVRFEFILRIAFLRKYGICYPHEIVRLRKVNLRKVVRLRKIDTSTLSNQGLDRAIAAWAKNSSARALFLTLKRKRIARPDLFVPCQMERRLRQMQRRLIW
jgi:hypothetical protein